MTYDIVRLIMWSVDSVPAAETTPPGACQHGRSFSRDFRLFPASQSAGQHETRACALDDAQNGPGHMAHQCPVCNINCADPPLEASKSLMVLISMPHNDSRLRSVGLEKGDFDVHLDPCHPDIQCRTFKFDHDIERYDCYVNLVFDIEDFDIECSFDLDV
jgi:hypothetical protein